jgi:hypothetical protein
MTPSTSVYVHVGTGRTPSRHFCETCDGYYGVPHEHPHPKHAGCACRPCQGSRYPSGGVMVDRALAHASINRPPDAVAAAVDPSSRPPDTETTT